MAPDQASPGGIALATLLASMALAVPGCKVGPDFQRPPSAMAEHWIAEPPGATPGPVETADWWKLFNDPTLNTLIDTAYHDNLSLQVAAARVLQAQAQLQVEIGNLFPQQQVLSGQAQYERQSRATLAAPGLDPVLSTASLGLSASWELDFWGKFRRAVEADRASMLASLAAYDNALVSLTASVASAYLNIRILQQRIAVAQANLQTQQESFRIARVQYENGATSELDVQQAKTQLAQTQAQIPALDNSLRAAKDSLAVLLGTTPDRLDTQVPDEGPIPVAPAAVATGMPKDLLRRRPDVLQAELTAAAQSAAIGVAEANLYPSFSLDGSFGFAATTFRGGSLTDLFRWDNRAASLGGSFVFPLLNYGRIVNSIRVQDAVFQQAVLNYQNTVLLAQQEVEDARAAFVAAQATLTRLTDAAVAAERAADLAIFRYKEGATDYTTVLSAQQLQLQVEDNLASARGNVPLALVSVYRALGGGWQLRTGQQLLPDAVRKAMKHRTSWGSLPDEGPRLPAIEQQSEGTGYEGNEH